MNNFTDGDFVAESYGFTATLKLLVNFKESYICPLGFQSFITKFNSLEGVGEFQTPKSSFNHCETMRFSVPEFVSENNRFNNSFGAAETLNLLHRFTQH
jgi:hypothetical protein